jgi:hypothetical protein
MAVASPGCFHPEIDGVDLLRPRKFGLRAPIQSRPRPRDLKAGHTIWALLPSNDRGVRRRSRRRATGPKDRVTGAASTLRTSCASQPARHALAATERLDDVGTRPLEHVDQGAQRGRLVGAGASPRPRRLFDGSGGLTRLLPGRAARLDSGKALALTLLSGTRPDFVIRQLP